MKTRKDNALEKDTNTEYVQKMLMSFRMYRDILMGSFICQYFLHQPKHIECCKTFKYLQNNHDIAKIYIGYTYLYS